jgi:hypothetical protein
MYTGRSLEAASIKAGQVLNQFLVICHQSIFLFVWNFCFSKVKKYFDKHKKGIR